MKERRYSLVDRVIINLDQGLATLSQAPLTGNRSNPAVGVEEMPMTADEKRLSQGLMRVNHSGEVSAQAL